MLDCWQCGTADDVRLYGLCGACVQHNTTMSREAITQTSDVFGAHVQTNSKDVAA